jgi:hypothetical protein
MTWGDIQLNRASGGANSRKTIKQHYLIKQTAEYLN